MPAKRTAEAPAAEQRQSRAKQPAAVRKPVDSYAQALRWSLVATALVTAGIAYFAYRTGVAAYEVALVAGALGAFFSYMLRMTYGSEAQRPAAAGQTSILDRAIYAVVPPLVGAIAAGFVTIVFATGLIEGGAFFPRFGCATSAGCASFTEFVSNYGPVEAVHYARLCLWAFAAGFAERMVPDRLRHPAARAQQA